MIDYCEEIFGWFDQSNKDFYQKIVELHNDGDIFVEVGCFKGKSTINMAVNIANSNKNIKFYGVDTWLGSPEHQEGESFADEDVIANRLFHIFLSNIEPVKNYITPIRKCSVDASSNFIDGSLSFVYLDASHDYENVKNDINAWYPKLKIGGILAGHDWHHHDVQKAVIEFATQKSLDIHTEGSWHIFIK